MFFELENIMWIYLGLTILAVLVLYLLCENSPEGYEDENGFHYGKDPRNSPVEPNQE